MCITQLGDKFKLTVDDFLDPFSQKPMYVERVVECRYVSSATKNFGVSLDHPIVSYLWQLCLIHSKYLTCFVPLCDLLFTPL